MWSNFFNYKHFAFWSLSCYFPKQYHRNIYTTSTKLVQIPEVFNIPIPAFNTNTRSIQYMPQKTNFTSIFHCCGNLLSIFIRLFAYSINRTIFKAIICMCIILVSSLALFIIRETEIYVFGVFSEDIKIIRIICDMQCMYILNRIVWKHLKYMDLKNAEVLMNNFLLSSFHVIELSWFYFISLANIIYTI